MVTSYWMPLSESTLSTLLLLYSTTLVDHDFLENVRTLPGITLLTLLFHIVPQNMLLMSISFMDYFKLLTLYTKPLPTLHILFQLIQS